MKRHGHGPDLISRKNPTAQLARCRAQQFGYSDYSSLAAVSFWVLKVVSVNMPIANKTQMMLMNILMMTFAFSMKDEEDEDYEPRVEVRRILTNIPKFPDISAFGPKSIGALKLLNDWIDDDVGEWLVTHEKGEFLDEDSGIPTTPFGQDDVKVKSESDGAGEESGEAGEEKAGEEAKPKKKAGIMSPAAKRMQKIADRKMMNFIASQASIDVPEGTPQRNL